MTQILTPEEHAEVKANIAAIDADFNEIVEYARDRSEEDPQFDLVARHLHDSHFPSDLALFIVGSSLGTARALRSERHTGYMQGVVDGAIRAAKVLNADVVIEDQDGQYAATGSGSCGG